MSEQAKRVTGWLIAFVAVAVMLVGLWPETAQADPDVREQQLAQRIACPWCHGQSLAESDSQVAQDLLIILREKVDEGWDDDQIYGFFAARYGDQELLDPPLSGWGIALWSLPLMGLVGGGWVIWTRQKAIE